MLTRRQFMKVGLASGVLLAGAGWLALRRGHAPASPFQWLDAPTAAIVAALVPAVLDGALPPDGPLRARAIGQTVEAFDRAVAGFSPAVRQEVDELFSLLGNPVGRFIVAGVRSPWNEATQEEALAFLARWRASRLSPLRAGYQAITQLTLAAWYGNSSSWERLGYAGPPSLGAPPS